MKLPVPFSPLIIDHDLEFLQTLRTHPLAGQIPPVVRNTGERAAAELSNPLRFFSAIFLNPSVPDPSYIPVIQSALKHKPMTPLYFLSDPTWEPLTTEELHRLTVRNILTKPVNYSDILDIIHNRPTAFNQESATRTTTISRDPMVEQEVPKSGKDFVPLLATHFMADTISFFDIYVRLFTRRYVKILEIGDSLSQDRLNTFLAKGLTHFYLRRDAQAGYLRYCDQLTASIVQKKSVSMEFKISVVANQGEETNSFLREHGLSHEAIQHSKNFVSNVRLLVDQLSPQRHEVLNHFLLNTADYDHGVATTMIASLLIQPFEFQAERSVHIVGLAALLHDIGMQGMPESFRAEDETLLTAEELKLYWTHPTRGAALLRQIPEIEITVIQAVEQHHERRNRTGFPNRIGAGALNRVSEIVGISGEFAHLIKKSTVNPDVKPIAEMKDRVFRNYSSQIGEAFQKIFPL